MLGSSAAVIASVLDPETPSVRRTPLVPATLGSDAPLYGAARAAILGEAVFAGGR